MVVLLWMLRAWERSKLMKNLWGYQFNANHSSWNDHSNWRIVNNVGHLVFFRWVKKIWGIYAQIKVVLNIVINDIYAFSEFRGGSWNNVANQMYPIGCSLGYDVQVYLFLFAAAALEYSEFYLSIQHFKALQISASFCFCVNSKKFWQRLKFKILKPPN